MLISDGSSDVCSSDLSRRALQDGDEEAVGTVPCRSQAQHLALGRTGTAEDRTPNLADRQEAEFLVPCQEIVHLRLVLLTQHGAGRVNQAPAGSDKHCSFVENARLLLPQPVEIGTGETRVLYRKS